MIPADAANWFDGNCQESRMGKPHTCSSDSTRQENQGIGIRQSSTGTEEPRGLQLYNVDVYK